jgi:hypothetical protein
MGKQLVTHHYCGCIVVTVGLARCYCVIVVTGLLMSAEPVTTIDFLNKEIQFIRSDNGAPPSDRLLDVGSTHACTPSPSSTPATIVHLHHQLWPPHTRAPSPARVHRLSNHHNCDCCLYARTTSPTCMCHHTHARMRPSVCLKQLSTFWFLSRAVPILESEVVLN